MTAYEARWRTLWRPFGSCDPILLIEVRQNTNGAPKIQRSISLAFEGLLSTPGYHTDDGVKCSSHAALANSSSSPMNSSSFKQHILRAQSPARPRQYATTSTSRVTPIQKMRECCSVLHTAARLARTDSSAAVSGFLLHRKVFSQYSIRHIIDTSTRSTSWISDQDSMEMWSLELSRLITIW